MRLATMLTPLVLGAGALNAQNLLRWDGWKTINAERVHKVEITETLIVVHPAPKPWTSESEWPGVEQPFVVPSDGLYQVHFDAVTFDNEVIIDCGAYSERPAPGLQIAKAMQLKAGTYTMRLRVRPAPWLVFNLWSSQPVVRAVVEPTTEVRISYDPSRWAYYTFAARGHVILASARRVDPIKLPGFAHGLELDPAAGLIVLAVGNGNVEFWWMPPSSMRIWPGDFYLQTVSLSPPAFGSRVYIK